MRVAINGRFTLQRLTGVQRHAREITRRLGSRAELIVPPAQTNGMRGHLWEQWRLPGRLGRQVLWSPCGTGPLSVRRQVITVHDTGFIDTPEYYSRTFAAWYRWLVPRLARRVGGVIAVSEFTRGQLVRHFRIAPERITVVPNGIEGFSPATPQQIAEVRRQLDLRHDYLLYVGSLKPNKNLARVLAAWDQAGLAARGLELAVVGAQGSVFGKYRLETVPAGVRLLGYVDDSQLPALYSGAQTFVFPSLYEGFGIPVVEAMACGTPVICSTTTSLPEVCGDAAWLVDPTQTEAIAAAMLQLANDETLRATLRARGLARAQLYTWETAANLTWQVLERVACG